MYLIEKLIDELENELLQFNEKIMKNIVNENETIDLQHYTLIFQEIKSYLRLMVDKYNLPPSHFNLAQVINSRKSKMWEVLCNTKTKQLKGFGEFPIEYAQEFDSDIDNLLKLTESI